MWRRAGISLRRRTPLRSKLGRKGRVMAAAAGTALVGGVLVTAVDCGRRAPAPSAATAPRPPSPSPPRTTPSPPRTAIALADDWLPALFSETAARPQPLRTRLVQMANERLRGPVHAQARRDRHFELYGIFPSFTVLGRRLLDDRRHGCHDQVDDQPLAAADLRRSGAAALTALQAHLRCDGLLGSGGRAGRLDGATARAIGRFRRKHMVPGPGRLDAELRELMLAGSRELDFRALLRALRERTADAAGLIEDGSAAGGPALVLGRPLDSQELRRGLARAAAAPIAGRAAPDHIGPATEAAARGLGWTSPGAARDWFRRHRVASEGGSPSFALPAAVAVALPPAPGYHRRHMALRVEIERGDVWLAAPGSHPRGGRRPAMVLYARDGREDVALARWPTTIGGWQPFEEEDGSLNLRHNESPVGETRWRQLYAGPAWYPPRGIPVRALLTRDAEGPRVREELIGPGYRAAYGLMALVHEQPRGGRLVDRGIRTHGTPSYLSVARGNSHGCHRLYNHLALRLGGFLLQHRLHLRHGPARQKYQRLLTWQEQPGAFQTLALESDLRGYRYELAPPVPVIVKPGRVRGSRAEVARAHPLPAAPRPSLANARPATF